jgi:UDP-N-acetylglucosamine 2-epimerase (non-hydrolysing)
VEIPPSVHTLEIPVAHVEVSLGRFDRTMPEEVNRILTDAICDMLLVSEPAAVENLKREGHPDAHSHTSTSSAMS